MNIHQLSVNYVTEQDRILVQANTVNGDVLCAWLTRRLTALMHPRLAHVATALELTHCQLSAPDEATRKMVMDFKKQETLLQMDFKTPFNQQAVTFPIGPEPLLATTVNFTRIGTDALRVEFLETLPHQTEIRSFQVTLAAEMLHGFMHLFDNAVSTSGWGLTAPLNTSAADEYPPFQVKKPVPPTYLN